MERPRTILVVVERSADPPALLAKTLRLAKPLGAHVELFLCDSEQAYVLGHSYDREGVMAARMASIVAARRYLSALRESAPEDLEMAIDAVCESPLYESIVRKVLRSGPDLVVKALVPAGAQATRAPDPNDWQLMRTCPAPLLLSRSRTWAHPARFAAAIDVSDAEPASLPRRVLEQAVLLAQAFQAQLEVVYGERGSASGSRAQPGKVRGLCSEAGIAPARTHVLSGEPERTLPEFLSAQGYDAVVLGALSHRASGTPPVGTLTTTLLDTLDCDFVLVKSASYRSPVEKAG